MVSALWNACEEGVLDPVVSLLNTSSPSDIEIKDHDGVTPLIRAVQSGHVEIVKALLAQGADPSNASNQGPPESYTSDPIIKEILTTAIQGHSSSGPQPPELGYPHAEPQGYYAPPPGAYYYPVPPPPLPEGAISYYPSPVPPIPGEQPPNGFGNLPPPDIARLIPCRYFPACRYGASCMFAHPQGQYMPPPMPSPGQYPVPYDPMYQPQNYYAGFPSPNSINPMSPHTGRVPTPPHPGMMHSSHSSEIPSPVTHFSPQGPIPIPYGTGPMSPTSYRPPSGQVPLMTPLPPPQHTIPPPPHGPQQTHPQMYPLSSPQGPMRPYPIPREDQYFPQPATEPNIPHKSLHMRPQADGYSNGQMYRDGHGFRRGGMRKPSFAGRKPPCLFFPSGRCRNGDECRFPHVIPDSNGVTPARAGPKPRYPLNGVTNLEHSLVQMNLNDDDKSSRTHPSTEVSSRSNSEDGVGLVKPNGFVNGTVKKSQVRAQRVPAPDEFPSLGASASSSKSPGPQLTNGSGGLTAAQVLQAPPPTRKDSGKDYSPEHSAGSVDYRQESKPINGVIGKEPGAHVFLPPSSSLEKIPLSFAAVATGTVNGGKELTVSA